MLEQLPIHMLSIVHENLHPTEKWDIPFILGVSSLNIGSSQCCQTINQISNKLHIKLSPQFFQLHINQNWKYNMKCIFFVWFCIIYDLCTLLQCHHERSQIWNFAKMSKSQLDGGFQCKLFLHINGSLKYTNYVLQIPMEHFWGVC